VKLAVAVLEIGCRQEEKKSKSKDTKKKKIVLKKTSTPGNDRSACHRVRTLDSGKERRKKIKRGSRGLKPRTFLIWNREMWEWENIKTKLQFLR